MSFWHSLMAELADLKYAEQIAYLKENHGFSQTHANALVMYSRGSASSRRFKDLEGYLAGQDAEKQRTVREIFAAIQKAYPELQLVIAWNQPMLKAPEGYVFGLSVQKQHILLGPWGKGVIDAFHDRLEGLEANKKTIKVPVGWKVDKKLLKDLVAFRLAEFD